MLFYNQFIFFTVEDEQNRESAGLEPRGEARWRTGMIRQEAGKEPFSSADSIRFRG